MEKAAESAKERHEGTSLAEPSTAWRVGIVGGGPRALWAVEELVGQARRRGVSLQVEVWDPFQPGAGRVYREDQPSYYRLNVRSDVVFSALGTLNQWRGSSTFFPPRREVGAFLSASFRHTQRTAPPNCRIEHIPEYVSDLAPIPAEPGGETAAAEGTHETAERPGRWQITGASGPRHYDEVLLCTGHADRWPGALRPGVVGGPGRVDLGDATSPIVASPYRGAATGGDPTDSGAPSPVPLELIPEGEAVGVRGAALTFIDTCMALSEGRGGVFRERADGSGLLDYHRSPDAGGPREPSVIYPVSRGGRFMEVKPDPSGGLNGLCTRELEGYSQQIRQAEGFADVRQALARAAVDLLCAGRLVSPQEGEQLTPAAARDRVEAVLNGTDSDPQQHSPLEEFRRSYLVAIGKAPASAAWAVGEALRRLYPALVQRASYGGRRLLEGEAKAFTGLTRRLERVAFGPPPQTAGAVIALADAGLVDDRFMGSAEVIDHWMAGKAEPGEGIAVAALVDAVIPPPGLVEGTLTQRLSARGLLEKDELTGSVRTNPDASVPAQPGLAVVGRDVEGTVLGHDTLNRTMHPEIPRWAHAVGQRAAARTGTQQGTLDRRMQALQPLTARLEPWAEDLCANQELCAELVEKWGSPVNVLHPEVLPANAAELVQAGADAGVDVRIFFARKANKALGFVDAAHRAGHGVDVASQRELTQVLDRGVPGEKIILSAAIKPDALLDIAIRAGAVISVDSVAELCRIEERARALAEGSPELRAKIAPRVAPEPDTLPPTRFGERAGVWLAALSRDGLDSHVSLVGVHLHLHGYSEGDRRIALGQALGLIDEVRELGHRPEFVDLGGGVPMSYLDDANEWHQFCARRQSLQDRLDAGVAIPGEEEFTWKMDPLRNTYPFHQSPTRGSWLAQLLAGELPGAVSAAQALKERGLRLHLEPGRSILDGGGVILARVTFVKTRSDGVGLVGLEMNRTQCRTTADDILADPLLIAPGGVASPRKRDNIGLEAYLVGAYCIEDEVIVRRKMAFPQGVCAGDIVAIPNTAGYFMHILESASHQIPLAKNVLLDGRGTARLDDIDRPMAHGTGN
ncbi:FAD/NAD(P)-binding protein [Corynebacterium heidelbergense]|uniref:Diaminopimelate decarboxylase n=1 Tax=Corynebacterium heidelbergense TaxID=2055947 RepID=A0A364V8L7_9CORY|nr:FAD/NAD(P)-binding protein [Corynebacterium heidelbergense]RAV32985.1 diaminopimelate decarboxylase [Corynebacterium heidelbergense]